MFKSILIGALLLSPAAAFAQTCLHGPNETRNERTRRDQAIQFARQVNAAERFANLGLNPERRYRPLNELPNLPRVPAGFVPRLLPDGAGYTLSLKDSRDPCGSAVFSTEGGADYAAVPEPHQATVLPLGTR